MNVIQLVRFCYMGRCEPTYTLNRSNVMDVRDRLVELSRICHCISAKDFLDIMYTMMTAADLPRRDETYFAYAVYLIADLRESAWRQVVRKEFPRIIVSESDLFLFLKYATMLQKVRGHASWVPRTVRKGLVSWYQVQSSESLTYMLTTRLHRHGFSHRVILKVCHIPDRKFREDCVPLIRKFFHKETMTQKNVSNSCELQQNGLPIQNLRLCRDTNQALRLINTYEITHEELPKFLLNNDEIYSLLVRKMSIPELLKSWKFIVRHHLNSFSVINEIRNALKDIRKLQECNMHPVNYLFYDHRVQTKMPPNIEEILKAIEKPKETLHLLRQVYPRTFGLNQPIGLRMHITINLQQFYLKKRVNGTDGKLLYSDAMIGLAFGYFKVENTVTVAFWQEKGTIGKIPWRKDMTLNEATKIVNNKSIPRSRQLLAAPISSALKKKKVYDIFLVIVPKQNPKHANKNNIKLHAELEKYHNTVNEHARYIFVNLCFNKITSLNLIKDTRNIFQICGLHENTTKLISEFAQGNFE